MKELIGIKKDEDILTILNPLPVDVRGFEAGLNISVVGPTLHPMRFCFEVPHTHAWNTELVEAFVLYFQSKFRIVPDELSVVYTHIQRRFTRLQTLWKQSRPKDGEDTVATKKRLAERKARVQAQARKDTRRQTVRSFYVLPMLSPNILEAGKSSTRCC